MAKKKIDIPTPDPISEAELERMRREIREAQEWQNRNRAVPDPMPYPYMPQPYRFDPPQPIGNVFDADANVIQPIYATGTSTAVNFGSYYEAESVSIPQNQRFWVVLTERGSVFSRHNSFEDAVETAKRTMGDNKMSYILECRGWIEQEGGEKRYIQAPIPEETKSEPPTPAEEIPF